MKKVLQFMVCAALATSGYAQTVFSTDFEDGTLSGMTMVDNDGLTPAPGLENFAAAWTVVTPQTFSVTSNAIISNSWYSPAGQADDWLITPSLMIADEGTAVLWNSRGHDPNFLDGLEVRVSTTDTELSSFTDVIYSSDAEEAQFEKRAVSLNDYIGQNIHIAFRNNSVDKYILVLDDIEVKVISARDVKVTSFETSPYHVKDADIPVSINVLNEGADELTSLDLKWSDGTNEYSETLTGLSIKTGETAMVTSSTPLVATEAILYALSVEISNPNGEADADVSDNTIDAAVSGVSYIPARKVVGEEGTGTWCGWCPRGTVALDYMEANFKEEFIGIAVHNGDPMVVAEYNSGMGFTGFPGGRIDRTFDIDPGNFEAGFDVFKNVVTPISVTASAVGDLESRTITVQADAEFVTQLVDVDFRISAIITEDGVTGTGSGYSQANYYSGGGAGNLIDVNGVNYANLSDPIPASEMVYDHVARAVLGGFDGMEGSIPSNLFNGDVASQELTWTVPANMDMNKMHVAVFVIDNATGAILNAGKADVTIPTSTTEIVDESISNVYPNPANQTAFIDINLKQASEVNLQVVSMMGNVITDQNLGKLSGFSQRAYDVSTLPTGMYLFRITAGDLVSTKKINVTK